MHARSRAESRGESRVGEVQVQRAVQQPGASPGRCGDPVSH